MLGKTSIPSTQQTTEWWITKPNYQFDNLGDKADADYVSSDGSSNQATATSAESPDAAGLAPPKSQKKTRTHRQRNDKVWKVTALLSYLSSILSTLFPSDLF
jgi:hypothetical protein